MAASPAVGVSARDLTEVILGYGLIVAAIWAPEGPQRILSLAALLVTLAIVLARWPGLDELGLGWRGVIPSAWILPAAIALGSLGALAARQFGTLHPLYKGDWKHIAGYVIWTIYQQFLMQDCFMPRLTRSFASENTALGVTTLLFAVAHLPNWPLTAATLVWGAVSCELFRRYRSLYVLGLAQGVLGLCFAVCIPDALHHHLRVGLGYLLYHPH